MGKLVEIAQFFDPEEAYCARGYLQSRGIDTIFQNEHHLAVAPWLRVALGGYRLMAMSEFEDEATRALNEVTSLDVNETAAQAAPNNEAPIPQEPRKKNWLWLPIAFLTAIPFLPAKKTGWAYSFRFFQFAVLVLLYMLLTWWMSSWIRW